MSSTDYILSENNKEDVKFTNSIYEYCKNNYFIPVENKHVVIAHSVMEIKQALVNITNYSIKFMDGKHRPYVTNKENNINTNVDKKNVIAVNITGYLPFRKINSTDYNDVITCVDNTWFPHMYTNHKERKNIIEDAAAAADIYLLSGKKLLGNPYDISLLPKTNIKISFGFIKNRDLAKLIQDQVNYISGGFDLHDITHVKEMLQTPITLLSVYKINNNTLKKGVNTIIKVINIYNMKYPDFKVKYQVEPTMLYVYVTSDEKVNIKKFIQVFNILNLEYKLNSSDQSIWTPKVKNGIYISTVKYKKSLNVKI
jgi:hypothetical protein